MRLAPATGWDLDQLIARLRPSDVEELRLARQAILPELPADWSPETDLIDQWARIEGETWAMFDPWDGAFLGLCGINPFPENPAVGAVWFLGTVEADARPKALTRGARAFLAMAAGEWFQIGNIVPRHYTSRRRWLEALGFDIAEAEAQGPFKRHVAFWSRPRPGPDDRAAAPREGKPAPAGQRNTRDVFT